MSLLPNNTYVNRDRPLFDLFGVANQISSLQNPNLITSTITNQFLTATGTLELTGVGNSNIWNLLDIPVAGSTVALGEMPDIDANGTLSFNEPLSGNPPSLVNIQAKGLLANANGGSGGTAYYGHISGAPTIEYIPSSGNQIPVLRTNAGTNSTAMTTISSINDLPYPYPISQLQQSYNLTTLLPSTIQGSNNTVSISSIQTGLGAGVYSVGCVVEPYLVSTPGAMLNLRLGSANINDGTGAHINLTNVGDSYNTVGTNILGDYGVIKSATGNIGVSYYYNAPSNFTALVSGLSNTAPTTYVLIQKLGN